ncbi:uncharacterized protein isoform X2 [Leptinotarsa decemlineata]|uniref:uncharacterized protein isoform X2 n=1 Tax=Leptinotarsa decemlineata TaxID=7539 RepID=UPI003D307593
MTCARCGSGVYEAEDQITLNKIWHKCCFSCRCCNTKLDKCTAKIFQGEIYCDDCYESIVEELEIFYSPPCRPCRVVSSPSCICIKKGGAAPNNTSSFDYSEKYDICSGPEQKVECPKIVQSCSCLVDTKKNTKPYCFAFPIPREVANYYNRSNMRKTANIYTSPPNCCPQEDSCVISRETECRPRIRVRTISPKKKICPPSRCRSSSLEQQKCCCNQCRQPSCPPPCACACPNNNSKPCYICCPCPPKPTCGSPLKRRPSPPRRKQCISRNPCEYNNKKCQECPATKPRHPCVFSNRNGEFQKQCTCCCEKTPKYCVCGRMNPCHCNISQIRAICTSICVRCGHKVATITFSEFPIMDMVHPNTFESMFIFTLFLS